jgi:anti-sigma factor RsiW
MSRDQKRGAKGSSKALSHEEARLLVSRAWDGEVGAEELRALSEHLQACAACAAAAERMRAFLGKIDDLLEDAS